MKYTHSDNHSWFYRAAERQPKPWIETNLNETDTIMSHFRKFVQVHDADICGDKIMFFEFDNGNCYRLSYSWWIEYDPEWDLKEEIEITKVKKEETKNLYSNRNWLVV